MRIVVAKLQNSILRVTGRVVWLVYCIVPTIIISPHNPRMICIIITPRSTTPQILMFLSNVTFVIKSLQVFTLYVNIKLSNMALVSGKQLLIGTISSMKLMMRMFQRNYAHVSIFSQIVNLNVPDTKSSIML